MGERLCRIGSDSCRGVLMADEEALRDLYFQSFSKRRKKYLEEDNEGTVPRTTKISRKKQLLSCTSSIYEPGTSTSSPHQTDSTHRKDSGLPTPPQDSAVLVCFGNIDEAGPSSSFPSQPNNSNSDSDIFALNANSTRQTHSTHRTHSTWSQDSAVCFGKIDEAGPSSSCPPQNDSDVLGSNLEQTDTTHETDLSCRKDSSSTLWKENEAFTSRESEGTADTSSRASLSSLSSARSTSSLSPDLFLCSPEEGPDEIQSDSENLGDHNQQENADQDNVHVDGNERGNEHGNSRQEEAGNNDENQRDDGNQQDEQRNSQSDEDANGDPGDHNNENNVVRTNHTRLKQVMLGPFSEEITTRFGASRNDLLYMALGCAKQNKFTNKAFNDQIRLLNCCFATSVLPTSSYLVDELVIGEGSGLKYIFYCRKCTAKFGELDHKTVKSITCENCTALNNISDLRSSTFFCIFDIASQVETLLGNTTVRRTLLKPCDAMRLSQPGVLSDIYDGVMYQQFALLFENYDHILSFHFCTDGSPLFKSSKCSIWPIALAINELPPIVRMKNLILGGLWFGKSQPPMDLFLEPFVNELRSLSEGFGVCVANEHWQMKGYCIGCCVDSGARGKVQGIKTHGGYNACNWCTIHGEYISGSVKYPLTDEPLISRSHHDIIRLQNRLIHAEGNQSEADISDDESQASEDDDFLGVNAVSPLINLPHFYMVDGFFVDSMHLFHLGIAKTFLTKWFEDCDAEYYINNSKDLINARILSLTPPLEFRRMPRTFDEISRLKARELENWLLSVCIPVLDGILPNKYLKSWHLLAQAVYLLCQKNVKECYINTADALLRQFVVECQDLYGDTAMSFNVHLLCHLAEHVSRWGPLWASSAYCFESFNGYLKSIIHSQQGIPHQVIRALSWDQAIKILEPRVSDKAREYVKNLPQKKQRGLPVGENCFLYGKPKLFVPHEKERWHCDRENYAIESCHLYNKFMKDGIVYSSCKGSTNNTMAQLSNCNIVLIRKIVYERDLDKIFLFLSNVHTVSMCRFSPEIHLPEKDHFMKIITFIEEESLFLSSEELETICFTATINKEYVARLPNVVNVC